MCSGSTDPEPEAIAASFLDALDDGDMSKMQGMVDEFTTLTINEDRSLIQIVSCDGFVARHRKADSREEEASIGVANGERWHMLGRVSGVAGSSERIYVMDRSVPAVRSYAWDGEYIGDLGREGRGPGEYVFPAAIDVADDGRVFVHARNERRVNVYAPSREFLGGYGLPFSTHDSMVLSPGGTTYGSVLAGSEDAYYRTAYGYQAHGPDGPFDAVLVAPRFEFQMPTLGGPRGLPVPYAPDYAWAMAPDGSMIAGVSDDYQFTIVRPDGSELLVRRTYEPIPIDEEERQNAIRGATEFIRRRNKQATWDGPPVPQFKPAYLRLMPTRSGELWVIRSGPSEVWGRLKSTGETVWRETYIVDAFDPGGRFLGEVSVPPGARSAIAAFVSDHGGPFAWVRDSAVIMPLENDAGTIMVKRYRLLLPGEEEH